MRCSSVMVIATTQPYSSVSELTLSVGSDLAQRFVMVPARNGVAHTFIPKLLTKQIHHHHYNYSIIVS